jgi:hypothetical protein
MKHTRLLALFMILYTVQLGAQETQTKDILRQIIPYKSFAYFNSDTVRFLEYNFTTRREQYEGKKVSELIKDMEFTVSHLVTVTHVVKDGPITDPDGKGKLNSLSLGIRQAGDKPSPKSDYYVEIRFKNPPMFDDFKKVFNVSAADRKFTPELYDFIKDLEISEIRANSYNIEIRNAIND